MKFIYNLIKSNNLLNTFTFDNFFTREDTFSFGVCNGFQLMSKLGILDIDFDKKNNIHSIPSKFGVKITKFIASISHSITLIFILSIGFIINLNPIYWFGCTIILLLFIREHIILKNITKENINTAFFDMNGQISIMFMVKKQKAEIFSFFYLKIIRRKNNKKA